MRQADLYYHCDTGIWFLRIRAKKANEEGSNGDVLIKLESFKKYLDFLNFPGGKKQELRY